MNKQWVGGIMVLGVVATAAFAAGGNSVYINGTKASDRVKTISGVPYVPLADVAKAYGGQVTKRPDGDWEIGASGGAYQVGNFQGKMGQEVFTGQFRVSVTGVQEVQSYTTKYRMNPYTITVENPNNKLVVVTCRIKNGLPTKQSLIMSVGGNYGTPNTALTTTDEQSFPPVVWRGDTSMGGVDVLEDMTTPSGITILPGAARIVNFVFLVAKDIQPKDMIVCLTPYDQWTKGDKKKFTDVRISLN
jgi:hypothetical protein